MKTAYLQVRSFEAQLEQLSSRLNWVIARLPFDAKAAWGQGGRVKVKGTINGFSFRTSLFPAPRIGGHFLLINKRMQAGAQATLGRRARFTLELDLEARRVETPPELARELKQDAALRRWYSGLNYSTQKYLAGWIAEAKQAATRERRAAQMAERLYQVMDAERELPPVIRQAFARNPRARRAWEQMPPLQRRAHLLAIFYYRTVDGRAQRVEKMMEAAEKWLEEKEDKKRIKEAGL